MKKSAERYKLMEMNYIETHSDKARIMFFKKKQSMNLIKTFSE